MHQIAFVTYAGLPELYPDDRPLIPPLAARGITVRPVLWNDPAVDWSAFDSIVLRSCWDYDSDPAGFVAWIDRLGALGSRTWNPVHVLRWNLDKTHLRELEQRGVAIVPTCWVERGSGASLASVLDALGTEEAVVKPTISLDAHGTWRTTRAAPEERRWRAQVEDRALMVQRYMPEIATGGEWSLVFLGGRYSHAALKHPSAGDFRVQTEYGGTCRAAEASAALVHTCAQILEVCPGPHLYARVDGVLAGGVFLLMEVELIDPALYLIGSQGGTERFAQAIEGTLRGSQGGSVSI